MSDCACTIDTIEKLCGESNAPNLNPLLSITCLEEVTSIPDPAANSLTIAGPIVMRAASVGPPAVTAGKFRKWFFEMKDSDYSCEQDENGLWNTIVKIFVPKLKNTTSYKISGLNGANYVALVEDMNKGDLRLIGDLVNGASIKAKEVTTPKNGYEITITWSSDKPPYWYSGVLTY